MKPAVRRWKTPAVIVCVLAATVALAATPYSITATISSGILSIQTSLMDRGWFQTGQTLDATKSQIVTTWSLDTTQTCTPNLMTSSTLYSQTSGQLSAQTGNQQVSGYTWDTTVDLAGAANHWWNHYHCDGTIERHGCDNAVTVTVTSSVYNRQGNLRTWVDDLGVTRNATFTTTASLPAVRDPDVYDTCESSCGIGHCVLECEAQCGSNQGNGVDHACKKACLCQCKRSLEPACPERNDCD